MGPLIRFAGALVLVASPVSAARVDRFAREIALASKRFGIPQSWIREVMDAESGGRTFLLGVPIVSGAGAMGLMQLMPGTFSEMREAHGLGSNPFDPHDNILAGAAYLRAMYDRFGYPGLFAAYNAGPGRYERFLSGTGLPSETLHYAARITGRIEKRARLVDHGPTIGRMLARGVLSSSLFAIPSEPATKMRSREGDSGDALVAIPD